MKNILIVEDESIVAMEIANYIRELELNVVATVSSALKAFEVLEKNDVDLILMDVYIKGDTDGVSCANEIRKTNNIPIIYISAFSDDDTLERAILTNPISYLVKPFNRKELKVAVKIALNRSRRKEDKQEVFQGDVILDEEFSYDTHNKELILEGEIIHLTKQEKKLLDLLIKSKNNIVSIYEMENYIWPDKPSNESTRRALISRLRSKLKYKFLETIHAIGYKLHI